MDMRSTLLCSLLVIGTAAQAEGIYVLASGGQSNLNLNVSRSDLDADWTYAGIDVDKSKLDTQDSAYKLQLGYQFNENFAIEGGYVDLGSAEYKADISFLNISGNDQLGIEAKGWNLAALLTLPINSGFSIFFKGGIIRAEVKSSEKIFLTDGVSSASASDSISDTKTKTNFGVGVAYNFYQKLSARAEIERFSNLEIGSFEADVDLYSVGLSYQF